MSSSQSIPDAARRMTAPLVASGAITAAKLAEIISSCEHFGAPGRVVPIVRAGSGGGGAPSLNSSGFTSVAAVSFAAQSHLTAAGAEAATAEWIAATGRYTNALATARTPFGAVLAHGQNMLATWRWMIAQSVSAGAQALRAQGAMIAPIHATAQDNARRLAK